MSKTYLVLFLFAGYLVYLIFHQETELSMQLITRACVQRLSSLPLVNSKKPEIKTVFQCKTVIFSTGYLGALSTYTYFCGKSEKTGITPAV